MARQKLVGRGKNKNFQTGEGAKRYIYPDIFIAFVSYNFSQFLKSGRAIAPHRFPPCKNLCLIVFTFYLKIKDQIH